MFQVVSIQQFYLFTHQLPPLLLGHPYRTSEADNSVDNLFVLKGTSATQQGETG